MHKKLTDMNPVDDIVTQNTPGLKIWEENWGGMQCAYHIFAPGTDFTDILKGKGLAHDLCGVEHWAYVLKGTLEVIYLDGSVDVCRAGEVCYLAGSAQLQVERRGRDHPVQHRWRVGCASQDSPGVFREKDEEVGVESLGTSGAGVPIALLTGLTNHRQERENKMKLKTGVDPTSWVSFKNTRGLPFHGMGAFVGIGKTQRAHVYTAASLPVDPEAYKKIDPKKLAEELEVDMCAVN